MPRRFLAIFLLCWLCISHSQLWADEALSLTAGTERTSLLSHAQWAHDIDSRWTLTDARRQHFEPLTDRELGRQNGSVWLHVSLQNPNESALSLVLDTGDEHTELVELFVVDANTNRVLQTGMIGVNLPYSQRPIKSSSLTFPLRLAAHQQIEVYLRLSSRFKMGADIAVYDNTAFINKELAESNWGMIFYGFLIALIFYNTVLAMYVHEREYMYFVAFLSTWTLLISSIDGVIYRLWPYALLGAYSPAIFYAVAGLAIITLSLFTTTYLRLKKFAPFLVWFQYAFIAWGFVAAIGASLLGYEIAYRTTLAVLLLQMIVDAYTGWAVYRKGQRFALEYTASFVIILMTILLLVLIGTRSGIDLTRAALVFPALLFSIGIAHRISELKKDAVSLQKNAELANYAAEFKSRFLAIMSHEIRTPMNGVLGMVDLLKDSALNHSQRQYLDILDNSGKALLSVINDILDFSKLESGNVELENLSIDLETFVDDCVGIFATACRGLDLQFTVDISPQLPRCFMGDPTRTKQVLINLLGNAFKFTERGQVSLRIVEKFERARPLICFEVADTGVGISPQAQASLFTPFGQADSSITRRYGGTGLGLAISKQLVDIMGGHLAVQSTLGSGSTFSVTLPLVVGEERALDDVAARDAVLKGKRILLVDDYEPFVYATRRLLQRWGLDISAAMSGGEAIKQLSQQTFDLILLDLKLPDGNGLQFIEAFRARMGNRDSAIITISSTDQIPSHDILLSHGITRHIIKPFQFLQLHRAIVETLGSKNGGEPNPLEPNNNLQGLRVLVAEDNPTNQIVLGSMLKKLAVDFDIVGDGEQAVARVRECIAGTRSYDAVLMDCEMPVMDGYTASSRIRALEKEAAAEPLFIIGISAHAMEEFHGVALDSGMSDYLVKPLKMAALRDALHKAKTTTRV